MKWKTPQDGDTKEELNISILKQLLYRREDFLSSSGKLTENYITSWLNIYILVWCELLRGIIGVVTFGFFTPGLDYRWIVWTDKKCFPRQRKK